MTWLNEWEVEEALRRFDDEDTPNLKKGSEILSRLVFWTNNNSDGWPYWQKPSRAANKLMELLNTQLHNFAPEDVTEAALKATLSPIKAFLTKQGVDHDSILEPPPPPPAPPALVQTLAHAVMAGAFIPAHDRTFDLAEEIGTRLVEFRDYVESVRDAEQASDALEELAEAIKSAVYDATRPKAEAT